ncbi:hypothetical protein YDYSY3_45310 [Paenibacillus chitinolyticus]|uniref:hypothetical protein n=1 Tax=Paenibacillus chitinolyticus TaxID=79263 RepID=UPI0026E4A2C0|nr:hypothetical protein [Paenibacillus chitinolyticus]GKS13531.1 hypothetical protein YDYSY3_45310 [Paenibacillus chitinolyticus]
MEAESIYVFNGRKFIEYIDVEMFKGLIEDEIGYSDSTIGFETYYEKLIAKKPKYKKYINELLFEHILYGRLTNIYIHKIKSPFKPAKQLLLKRAEKVIDSFKNHLSASIQEMMTAEDFYLMDLINVTVDGGHFIAGFDYTEDNGIIQTMRFLVGKNIYRKRLVNKTEEVRSEYLLGGIEINFEEGYFLILNKHTTNMFDEDEEDRITSPSAFHTYMLNKIIQPLNIEPNFDSKKDQEGMSDFCKYLFNELIDDDRQNINTLTKSDIDLFGRKAAEHMKNGKKPANATQMKDFKDKVKALLLGIYIMNNYEEDDMRIKARTLDMIGYPTKISYKNAKSNRSSTGTNRATRCIANSDTIYSLLTDFENTKYLEKWSMSWFVDHNNKTNLDVVQTTIEARKKYFKVTLIAFRHFTKEIIHNVIENLNSYRDY